MDYLETSNDSMAENISPQEVKAHKHHYSTVKRFCSARYGLAIIMHFCNLILSSQLFSLSIAIIAMVNHTDYSNKSNVSERGNPDATTDARVPVYEWSPEIQGILLSAVIYGAFITTIPGGYFAGIHGGKTMAGISLFITSVLTLLTPLAADQGVSYFILLRIAQGMAQGIAFTGVISIWQKWAPPMERSILNNISSSGLTMGNFVIILVGGILCHSSGWPSVFYISGGVGCIFCIFWFALVHDNPKNHPFISNGEKDYIISSLAGQDSSPNRSLPYKAMLKSLPLWSILIASICRQWLVTNLTMSLPILMDNIFHLTFKKNGFLSALPLLSAWITMNLGGQIADFLLYKKICTLITVRKLFTFLGMLLPSVFIAVVPCVGSITSMVFMILAMSISTLCFSGFLINQMDIAPRFLGFLSGVIHIVSLMSMSLSSTFTGYLLNQDPESGWKTVFFLSSAINLAGMIVYLIFGQADIQDWAKDNRGTHF